MNRHTQITLFAVAVGAWATKHAEPWAVGTTAVGAMVGIEIYNEVQSRING